MPFQTGQRVVIAGCGVAGAAAALGLRQAGFAPEVYEARPRADAGGAWLNLAPNGVAAMDALGLGARVRAAGHAARGLRFQGANGKVQFEADFGDAEKTYGAPFLNLRRADLYAVLQQGLHDAGIPVHFGQRLETFSQQPDGSVRVQFDERVVETPLLVGADGLRSRVRQTLFPPAAAKYAGIVGLGGYSRPAGLRGDDWIVFTQGPDAFFGSVAEADGGVWWFSNIPAASEPPRAEIAPETWPAWLERARARHRNDVDPIPRILAAQTDPVSIVPEYEVPSLPNWSRGNVVLIGDAAHAMPPHSGQGASMGLEDALVLAGALADASSPTAAFAEYERQRRPRVRTALRIAHEHGIRKQAGPVTGALLDVMMPVLARLGQRQLDTLLRYRVPPVAA